MTLAPIALDVREAFARRDFDDALVAAGHDYGPALLRDVGALEELRTVRMGGEDVKNSESRRN